MSLHYTTICPSRQSGRLGSLLAVLFVSVLPQMAKPFRGFPERQTHKSYTTVLPVQNRADVVIFDAVTIVMPAMDKAPNKPHRRIVFDCAKLRTHTSFPQAVGRKLLRENFPSGSTREKFPRLNDYLRDKIGDRFFGCQIKK